LTSQVKRWSTAKARLVQSKKWLKRSGKCSSGAPTPATITTTALLHTICVISQKSFDSKIFWHYDAITQTAFASANEPKQQFFPTRQNISRRHNRHNAQNQSSGSFCRPNARHHPINQMNRHDR
jgi:hypothetical protein